MNLYIRISDTELCFAAYEIGASQSFQFSTFRMQPSASLTVNLRTAMQQVELLRQQTFSKVEVYVNAPVTPVPLAEFQEEDAETIYNYCFTPDERQRVFYDTVPASNAVLLFALSEATCRTLEEAFEGISVRFAASLTPIVQHFAKKGLAVAADKRVFAYTHDMTLDIVVLEDSHIVMLNTYQVRTLTDADYYLFNLMHHLGLSTSDTPIFVTGTPLMRGPLITELQKYAAKVYPVNPSAEFNRHTISTTKGVPYDLMCALLK